jgi:hypothetical protein
MFLDMKTQIDPQIFAPKPILSCREADLIANLKAAVASEKSASLQVLEYLSEVNTRRLYAVGSCSTLFEYVVRELGYSETQASERINSMRLLQDIPDVKTMLTQGILSMTTAAQIQRFIKNEKKFTGESLDEHSKRIVIEKCANKSKREVEKILFQLHSDEVKIQISERVRRVSDTHIELRFAVSEKVMEKVNGVRNLVGEATLATLFENSICLYLEKLNKDKKAELNLTGKVAFPAKKNKMRGEGSIHSRYVPRRMKRMLFARSNGQCEYVDPNTGNRCLSCCRIQIDHILPFSLGGKTEIENLRHLCQGHNLRSAIQWFS